MRIFRLDGAIGHAGAKEFIDAIESAPIETGEAVLVDARGLLSCERDVRSLLVTAQKVLSRSSCRTAWLVDRPSTHGLAMWVVNLAGDPGARTVASEGLAEEWFESSLPRLEQNQDLFEAAVAGVRRWGRR